ncbi:MAG TPA: cytochrome c biogenesis protein CcsA [bacterium]
MNFFETFFFWIGVFFYILSFILLLIFVIFKKEKVSPLVIYITSAGFIFHTCSGVIRWIATSHPPVLAGYENSLAGAWFVILIAILLSFRYRVARYFLLLVLPFSLLMLGNGLMHGSSYESLSPSFKSPWLAVHVLFAWLAYGSFAVASGVSVYYILIHSGVVGNEDRKRGLDDINLRLIGFGFIAHTVMVGAGAIWAYGLWGSYWSWDPVETWSLITWFAYGLNIHLQLTMGWRGLRGAIVTVLCLGTVIITYFGLGLIPDLHAGLL